MAVQIDRHSERIMVVKVVFSDISKCLLSMFLLSHDKRLVRHVKVLPDISLDIFKEE